MLFPSDFNWVRIVWKSVQSIPQKENFFLFPNCFLPFVKTNLIIWLTDWLIVWCLTPISTLFQLYHSGHSTYQCFPGVLLTSTVLNVLSKPLAAFPHNHYRHSSFKPCLTFPKQALFLTCLHYKSFENTEGKGEIARNEQILLFPQCFVQVLKTFCHFHQIWNCRL